MEHSGPTIAIAKEVAQSLRQLRSEAEVLALFADHDLPDLFRTSEDTRIAARQEAHFVQAACDLAGDLDLAFEIGLKQSCPADLPGYIARHSASVRDGINTAKLYVRAIRPGLVFDLDESGNAARLTAAIQDPALTNCPRLLELVLAGITAQIRSFTQRAFYPLGLSFTHARVDVCPKVRARLGCDVEFSSGETVLTIGHATLDAPMVSRDDVLKGFLIAQGDRVLEAAEARPLSVAETVELLIETSLPGGLPSQAGIARDMGLSPRSLSRRLQEAKTSFSEIVNHVRLRVGMRDLAESDLPVSEIAYRLGYAGQSAFATAFRRETGTSPSAYRKSRQDDPARA